VQCRRKETQAFVNTNQTQYISLSVLSSPEKCYINLCPCLRSIFLNPNTAFYLEKSKISYFKVPPVGTTLFHRDDK